MINVTRSFMPPFEEYQKYIEKIWDNRYKYWYIVHGHTPVQTIQPDKVIPEIYRYYNNHKIDIDMGTPSSNKIAVLDLDTLQVKYFKENKDE